MTANYHTHNIVERFQFFSKDLILTIKKIYIEIDHMYINGQYLIFYK